MDRPSPVSHLFRLAGLLVLGLIGFVVVRGALEPETWSHADAYRKGSLEDLKELPSYHGGNASCVNCHEDEEGTHQEAMDTLADSAHATLSCEACHGSLAEHVADGKKIADARIEYSRTVCLGCHENLISTPADFPKMILADEELSPSREAELMKAAEAAGKSKFYRHKSRIHAGMNCNECHLSFHDPEP